MKQVLQNLRTGEVRVEDVPVPHCGRDQVLIRTTRSLLSPGTERMLLEFGRGNLLEKARSQPEKLRQVWQKMQTEGVLPTLEAVKAKLDEPLPLGYCNVGVVEECGEALGATGLRPGLRVASNGYHAEFVLPGPNLVVPVPQAVLDDEAAFTVIGAVALQGIRLAAPTLGETFFVAGLGLVGLLTVQLLRANGCRVLASDFNESRLELARRFGAETVSLSSGGSAVDFADSSTNGRGVDGVLITAATKSADLVRESAQMCRRRGRIVLVGVAGLELDRTEFFRKELTFQVSCSYGPGRYDAKYESGNDYPPGHVRWTAQRNFEAVLQMMAEKRLQVEPLITHREKIANAAAAYEALMNGSDALGILLEYEESPRRQAFIRTGKPSPAGAATPSVAVIGAGSYSRKVILPALKKSGCTLDCIVSARGTSAATAAKQHGFSASSTDAAAACEAETNNCVFIATRHSTHADLVCRALRAGKHVFVEKPLAINMEQLADVAAALAQRPEAAFCVGFNRRFSPAIHKLQEFLPNAGGTMAIDYHVNAGRVPADSWVHDPEVGGGRIIGEVCHFIDTVQILAGEPWERIHVQGPREDQVDISIQFPGGSHAVVHYWTNGPATLPKERVQVFRGGIAAELVNFREIITHQAGKINRRRSLRQDKGHSAEIRQFLDHVQGKGAAPMEADEAIAVTLATFAAVESWRTGAPQLRSSWEERLAAAVALRVG